MKNAGKSIYLPKKERQLAEKLAMKKYYKLRKQDLMRELEACNAYIRKVQKENNASINLIMTYETNDCPIGMERIEQMAEYYFG